MPQQARNTNTYIYLRVSKVTVMCNTWIEHICPNTKVRILNSTAIQRRWINNIISGAIFPNRGGKRREEEEWGGGAGGVTAHCPGWRKASLRGDRSGPGADVPWWTWRRRWEAARCRAGSAGTATSHRSGLQHQQNLWSTPSPAYLPTLTISLG